MRILRMGWAPWYSALKKIVVFLVMRATLAMTATS
jgi:hypothetical protein